MKFTLRKKIILSAILPLLLLGASIIIIAATIVKGSIISKVEESLKGTAVATQAAYDQNAGSYLKAENGAIWKGSYNISQSETLVDTIKEESGMDVTFFYGSDRIMTSAKDKDGNRLLGSPAGDKIKKRVLEQGKEYFSDNISIDGTIYYGYYVPVYQDGSKDAPVGIVFAGQEKQKTFRSVLKIINTIVAMVVIIMVICSIAVGISANSITRALNKSIAEVLEVSSGNLNVRQNRKLLHRKDEIGNLSRAVHSLQEELCKIIGDIKDSTDTLLDASNTLEETSQDTHNSIGEVNHAMDTITGGANRQAEDVGRASDNVRDMGELIIQTGKEADSLESSADSMKGASDKTAVTIDELRGISEDVKRAVSEIAEQTTQTNSSAQSIREASQFISEIAEETNLLSLNASIEAARAGEAGKGFAVVASEISKLANETSDSVTSINEIVLEVNSSVDEMVQSMEGTTKFLDEVVLKDYDQFRAISDQYNNDADVVKTSMENVEHAILSLTDSIGVIADAITGINTTIDEATVGVTDIAEKTGSVVTEAAQNAELVDTCMDSVEQLEKIADKFTL